MHSCRIAIRKDFIKMGRKAPVMETFCNSTVPNMQRYSKRSSSQTLCQSGDTSHQCLD